MSSPQDKSSDKVPTEIVYDVNAPDGLRWGYQIQENTPRHQWFKLYVTPCLTIDDDLTVMLT